MTPTPSSIERILADVAHGAEAAAELVARGAQAWQDDLLLRLAGEAIIGRIADAAHRLPSEVKDAIPDVPWDEIRDMRIIVDHVYHRIDYDILWQTLSEDVPSLQPRLAEWRSSI